MEHENISLSQKIFKVAKRIGLTVMCCLPVLAIFAYYTRNAKNVNLIQILGFTLIMLIAVFVEEIVYSKLQKKKYKDKIFSQKDVFK